MNNEEQMPNMHESSKKKNYFLGIIIVVLVIVLIGGIAIGLHIFDKETTNIGGNDKEVSFKIEKEKDISCASVITPIYEDSNYIYSVADSCVATGTYVVFSNGEKYSVKDALNNGKVTIVGLEEAGIQIYRDSKNVSWKFKKDNSISCTGEITPIYEDNEYVYSVIDSCIATGTYIVFSNGEKYTVKDAVNNGKATIEELEKNGIKIYKDAK